MISASPSPAPDEVLVDRAGGTPAGRDGVDDRLGSGHDVAAGEDPGVPGRERPRVGDDAGAGADLDAGALGQDRRIGLLPDRDEDGRRRRRIASLPGTGAQTARPPSDVARRGAARRHGPPLVAPSGADDLGRRPRRSGWRRLRARRPRPPRSGPASRRGRGGTGRSPSRRRSAGRTARRPSPCCRRRRRPPRR